MNNSKKVLVVDDDPSITSVFEFILQQAGYTVITASNGQDCLDTFEKETQIDLVFLDIKMPGISGIDTMRTLHADRPNLKVILMSGYSVDRLITESYTLGAYGLILKPFDVEEVLAIIQQVFSEKVPAR